MIQPEIVSHNQVPETVEELRLVVQSQQKQLESLRAYYVQELQSLKEQLEALEKLGNKPVDLT